MNYFRPKPQDKRESGPQALYVDGTSENVSRHKTCSQRQIQMHIDSALRAKAGGGTFSHPSVPSLGSYTCFGGMGVTLIRELALSLPSSIAYAPPPPNKGRCCCCCCCARRRRRGCCHRRRRRGGEVKSARPRAAREGGREEGEGRG